MTNGIPYPIHPDLKLAIEERRKEFAKENRIKMRSISQTRFTKLLIPIIKGAKINTRRIIYNNGNRRKKTKKK